MTEPADPERPVVIANPRAKNGRVGRRWPEIEATLREALGDVEVRHTEHATHAPGLVRGLLRRGWRRFVSVGGDGTHGQVVAGFFEDGAAIAPEATLSLVPVGTGGDFARMLDLPRGDLAAAAGAAATDRIAAVDVGHVRFHDDDGVPGLETTFLNVASFGASGEIVRVVNRRSKALGALAYLRTSIEALFRYTPRRVTLTVDGGRPNTAEVLTVAVCNGGWFGGGMHVGPDARADDGLLDVVVMPWRGVPSHLLRGLDIYRGAHVRHGGVSVTRGRVVEVEGDAFLDVDGESPGRLPATFQIVPQGLRLRGTIPRPPVPAS